MRTPNTTRLIRRPSLAEPLEARRMLSATLSVSAPLMVFNAVTTQASQVETLTLTNTGDAALALTGVSIVADPSQSVDASARFAVTNAPSLPATLAAGASFNLTLDYVPTAKGLDEALLDIASSDPAHPTTSVQLHGIGTLGDGGQYQPSLMRILQAYDLPNYDQVGETDPNSAYYPEPPAANSTEVDLQQMVKAGPGDVTFTVLASFTGDATTPLRIGWYQPGNVAGTMVDLFHTVQSEYQSVYVQPVGNTSFDPGSDVFGLYNPSQTVRVNGQLITDYTQDALNTNDTTDPRKFRFFPYINAAVVAVPNAYIMTATEWPAPVGYDFTNIVAIISNVKQAAPVAVADAATAVAATPTTVNVLANDTATTGTLTPSSVTITTAPASGGTVTVDPTTGQATYTAPANFHGADTFAYTVANSAGYTSAPATVTVTVSAGVGGIVTAPVTATAVAGVTQTINVLGVDTDSSGTLLPATVTIATAPSAGGTATVNANGTVAYIPAVTFTGTETFTYTVSDSAGATSNPTTVTVTVANPADAPVAGLIDAQAVVNTVVSINVVPSVTSTVGLNLATLALSAQPEFGTAVVNADGTISYTPKTGFVGNDSMTYTVADSNGHTSNVGEITVEVGVNVGTEAGDYHSLVFAQNANAGLQELVVTLTLSRGTAFVALTNGSLTVGKSGIAQVFGDLQEIESIRLRNTTVSSTLSVTAPKSPPNVPSIGNITDADPLGRLIAPTAILTGTSQFASVQTVQLGGANQATLTVGSNSASVASLSLGTVTDSALTSAVPIKSLKAAAWTTAGAASITAPSIGALNVTGNFQPTVTLTSTGAALNAATIAGQLGGASAWTVAGSVRSLTVGTITANAQLRIAGTLTNLLVRAGGLPATLSAGALGSATIRGDLTGTLTAATAKAIRVTGNVAGATLSFTGAGTSLNTFAVTGAFMSSTLTTAGSVGTLSAALFNGDRILVGATAGTTFANVTTADLGTATLNSLRLTARAGTAFADTTLIAHAVGSATVGVVATDNGGVPDGLAVATAKSVVGTANGTPFRLSRVAATKTFGDFEIKVVTA